MPCKQGGFSAGDAARIPLQAPKCTGAYAASPVPSLSDDSLTVLLLPGVLQAFAEACCLLSNGCSGGQD